MTAAEYRARKAPMKGRHKRGDLVCDLLASQLSGMGLTVVRELPFAKELGRRWRFDLAIEERKIAVEVDGGVWNGGHSRGGAIDAEHDKYNTAVLLGWRVLRATHKAVKDGSASTWVWRVVVGR